MCGLFRGNCYYTCPGDVRIYPAQGGKTSLLSKDHSTINGRHSFLSRFVKCKELHTPPMIKQWLMRFDDEIFIVTDRKYRYNEVASPEILAMKGVND